MRAGLVTGIVFVLIAGSASGCMPFAEEPVMTSPVTSIVGADAAGVGERVSLTVSVEGGAATTVVIIGAHGEEARDLAVREGRASLVLEPPLTDRAGLVTVVGIGSGNLVRHDLRLIAGAPAGTIDLFVGPRTVVGETAEPTMAVALVTDSLGNPVADQTEVGFVVTGPTGRTELVQVPIDNGLAALRVDPAAEAGLLTIAASAQSADSLAGTVRVQPGLPVSPRLTGPGPDQLLVADGRSMTAISSEPVTDRSGTALPDGTAVSLTTTGPTGTGISFGTIRSGRIQALIPAPSAPGRLEISAMVHDVVSDALELEFSPALDPFDVVVSRHDGRLVVDVGPVRSRTGGLLPDGTIVLIGDAIHRLVDGRVTVELPASEVPSITVLGIDGVVR